MRIPLRRKPKDSLRKARPLRVKSGPKPQAEKRKRWTTGLRFLYPYPCRETDAGGYVERVGMVEPSKQVERIEANPILNIQRCDGGEKQVVKQQIPNCQEKVLLSEKIPVPKPALVGKGRESKTRGKNLTC